VFVIRREEPRPIKFGHVDVIRLLFSLLFAFPYFFVSIYTLR
jgi:hypothetical protein